VAAAPDLAVGPEQAHVGLAQVPAQPPDGDEGTELLVGEVGAVGAGQDHAAPTVVLGHERRVRRRAEPPGAPDTPARGGDRPRIDGRDGRAEQLAALEKERPLLGIEQGEALVDADLGDVGLDLRKVGVHGGVHCGAGGGRPFQVEAGVAFDLFVVPRGAGAVRGRAGLPSGGVGRQHEVAAGGQALEAVEGAAPANEAAAPARQLHVEELVAVVAGVVAVEDDAPGTRVAPRIAQRREGDSHLERPALAGDSAHRVPEIVGGGVLVARRII
jgi:hypothetical protein